MKIDELMQTPHEFVAIETSASVRDALESLRQAKSEFALVVDSERPADSVAASYAVTLLDEQQLVALAVVDQPPDASALLLESVREQLPALLIVDETELKAEDLTEIIKTLSVSRAAGAVVYQDDLPVGVIRRRDIAKALPLEELAQISVGSMERSLDNVLVTAFRTYICRKCKPATRRRPRIGDGPPRCSKFTHGTMELE